MRQRPSLDTWKVEDKKDAGPLTVKVLYHQVKKGGQLAALKLEMKIPEERRKLKAEGVIGSTMDTLDETSSVVGPTVSNSEVQHFHIHQVAFCYLTVITVGKLYALSNGSLVDVFSS